MGVDEDEEVSEEGGEGEGGGEEGPGGGVRVEDYGEKEDGGFCMDACVLVIAGFGEGGRKGWIYRPRACCSGLSRQACPF